MIPTAIVHGLLAGVLARLFALTFAEPSVDAAIARKDADGGVRTAVGPL
jgi:hypothetical protein